MTFLQAIQSGFSNYATFSGRAVRSEYWYWVLFVSIIGIVAYILDLMIVHHRRGPLEIIWNIATLLPHTALAVRRLHDIDRTGWWLLAIIAATVAAALIFIRIGNPILPMVIILIGILALVYLLCQSGTEGPNRFGPDRLAELAAQASPRPAA